MVINIILFCLILFFVLGVAFILAPKGNRCIVSILVLAGVLISLGKIAIVQHTPQWRDIPPDSITYQLRSEALSKHWNGLSVDSSDYHLSGLEARQESTWKSESTLAYTSLFGSREWLYSGYVGLWYWIAGPSTDWVIISNAAWAAFFPAAAYGIAFLLSGSLKLSWWSAGLALIEPMSGVNASWLLKDTLAGFLTMAVLWAGIDYLRSERKATVAILLLTLSLLSTVRYVSFLALLAGLGLVGVWLIVRKTYKPAVVLLISTIGAVTLTGYLYQTPVSAAISMQKMLSAVLVHPIEAAVQTLTARHGDSYDEAVFSWKEAFKTDPVRAVFKSIMHTMFAPYPWEVFYPGLTKRLANELYYPGMLLWIICLPGIFVAIARAIRDDYDPAWWLLIFYLGFMLAAYTVFFGEWSTRQRVFVLPAFFALASIGWHNILTKKYGGGK